MSRLRGRCNIDFDYNRFRFELLKALKGKDYAAKIRAGGDSDSDSEA
jgi:hypothetical protein